MNIRRVKIVCTLGPSSSTEEKIEQMLLAGMNVARLNFSHGTHEFHLSLIQKIRAVASRLGRNVGILQDLQGPKLRVGKLPENGIILEPGSSWVLYPEGEDLTQKNISSLPISREIAFTIAKDVQVGARILFDDGKISTIVRKVDGVEIEIEVQNGGLLTSNKGMNLPGTPLSLDCVTEKDLKDLEFGVQNGVDYVALSFVRAPSEIEKIKQRVLDLKPKVLPWIGAKIERAEAVDDLEGLIEVADFMLVARGDMAVELGAEQVPAIQKKMIRLCNQLGVPVITATQMLESMVFAPTPTRAEANDVANAVYDGTDAVMLSAESASGRYPIEAVSMMERIILHAEATRDSFSRAEKILPTPGIVVDSIEYSAARIAEHVGAVAVVCLSRTGTAPRILAKYRPEKNIIAIFDDPDIASKMSLVWGVEAVIVDDFPPTDELFLRVEDVLLQRKKIERSQWIVITAGVPALRKGTTNMVKVHEVGARRERLDLSDERREQSF